MRRFAILVLVLALVCTAFAQEKKGEKKEEQKAEETAAAPAPAPEPAPAAKTPFETEEQKLSYALGMDIGTSLKRFPVELDTAMLTRAIEDVFKERDTLLSQEEFRATMKELPKIIDQAVAKKNLEEGQEFLKENATKEGVVTTESGLQYIVLKEGEGETPTANDTVSVNYVGTLINGAEFDRSKEGNPTTFKVNEVIAGWTEALQLMKVGSKYKLFIPSDLAYGEERKGRFIRANSALIFEVELVGIEKAKAADPAPKGRLGPTR